MDHTPFPENPVFPRPQVRYFCDDGFEDLLERTPFEKYPEAKGINVQRASYDTYGAAVMDSFLQEWAYFGLLRECLRTRDIEFDVSDLVRSTDDGDKIVNSEYLPGLFDAPTGATRGDAGDAGSSNQSSAGDQRTIGVLRLVGSVLQTCMSQAEPVVDEVSWLSASKALHISISL